MAGVQATQTNRIRCCRALMSVSSLARSTDSGQELPDMQLRIKNRVRPSTRHTREGQTWPDLPGFVRLDRNFACIRRAACVSLPVLCDSICMICRSRFRQKSHAHGILANSTTTSDGCLPFDAKASFENKLPETVIFGLVEFHSSSRREMGCV